MLPGDFFFWEIYQRVQVGFSVDRRQRWKKMELPVEVDPSPVGFGINV